MPAERHVDPTWLDVVATQLARSSTAALEASHELVAHYSDTGDAPAQRAVDTLINHAVEALGALTDSLADASHTLQEAAGGATTFQGTTSQEAAGGATTFQGTTSQEAAGGATTFQGMTSQATASQATASRHGEADGSSARSIRRRDHGA